MSRTASAPAGDRGTSRRTQAQRREESERRLLDAALQIVACHGVARLTLAEVGETAGYSRGLPAIRFGNKAGLWRALAMHIGERYSEHVRAAPARAPGLDAIRGNIEVYFGRTDRNWTTTRALLVMMTEGFMGPDALRRDLADYNRAALSFFEHHIRAGIESGEIDPSIDPSANAALLLGAMRGVLMQRLLDERIDLPRVRDRLIQIVDGMLRWRG